MEIRVVHPIGSIMTSDGHSVDLQPNTTHFLLRQDVESFIQQGLVRLM